MSVPEAPPPEVSGRDLIVVGRQLGRVPRHMSRVAARCPYGQPAVVECLPADLEGRPFPTLYYCTCPTLVAAVGALESAGGVRIWARRLVETPALSASLAAAVRDTRRRREDLLRSYGLELLGGGANLTIGGRRSRRHGGGQVPACARGACLGLPRVPLGRGDVGRDRAALVR